MRTHSGGTNRSTRSTQELVSLRERQLQEVWGEALNKEEVERNILGTVMDDILQRAVEEAIPEIVVEARSELEQAVQQSAAMILEEVAAATAAATASTPVAEIVSEPREGALAPSQSTSVAEDTSPGPRATPIQTPVAEDTITGSVAIQIEASVAEESITVPEALQVEAHQREVLGEERSSIETDPIQSEREIVVSDASPTPGTSTVVQLQVENIQSLEQHRVQVHQVQQERDSSGDTDESDWSDRLVQGDVAPELLVFQQKNLRRAGVFLVIATNVINDLWTTQLVEGTLTIKEQRNIRNNKGEVLITRDLDAYRVANMNLDVEWLQHQVKMRKEEQARNRGGESQGVAGPSNVAVRASEEIEVEETPQDQENSDEDYNPDQETGSEGEDSSEDEEQPAQISGSGTAGIGEMLQELSEESSAKESTMGSPRVPKPKRKRKHS